MALTRLGVLNGASPSTIATHPALTTDERYLFQNQYLTDVLAAFQNENLTERLHDIRVISGAKSATFPTIGTTTAQYHIPGTTGDLAGTNSVKLGEKVIHVDRVLMSDILIAQVDELMSYWDVRGRYAALQGHALSEAYDSYRLQLIAKAARTTSDGVGNTISNRQVTLANAGTDADVLAGGMFSVAQKFAEQKVTDANAGRPVAVFRPAQYYLLAQAGQLLDSQIGGSGGIADGKIWKLAGFPIYMHNLVPSSNAAAVTGQVNDYAVDCSKTVGLIFRRAAIGTVRIHGLMLETEYLIQKQATLFVAKMLEGAGILRPEAAAEIVTP